MYHLDDKPPFAHLMLYGLQWFIALLPTAVIMGQVVASLHYTDLAGQTLYIQKLFVILGITTLIQVLWGHKLPLIVGPSSILLIGIVSTLSSGMIEVYSSITIGGALLVFASAAGILKRIHHYFTPRVITVILALIAMTLSPVILRLAIGNTTQPLSNLLLFILLIFILLLGERVLKGVIKSTLLLWGLLIGWGLFLLLPDASISTQVNTLKEEISFLILPDFKINAGVLLAFLFCYLAFSINELSSIEALGHLLKVEDGAKRNKRGMIVAGGTNILSGLTGTIGTVDFSMSVGMVQTMKCASRYTMIPTAFMLIACALIPGIIPIFLSIPKPVMAAMMLYVMSLQLGTSLRMISTGEIVNDSSSAMIVSVPIMLSLIIAFTPEKVFIENLPMLRPIIGNAFVMGCLCVFILEHIIFRQTKNKQQ